jgi:hypothetical protein
MALYNNTNDWNAAMKLARCSGLVAKGLYDYDPVTARSPISSPHKDKEVTVDVMEMSVDEEK